MAEFTEVCRQALRMNAELARARGGKPDYMVLYISKDGTVKLEGGGDTGTAEGIERFIMDWAAKHPEPVYPNWVNVLYRLGVLSDVTGDDGRIHISELTERAYRPIPADIAAKLGIKPIENKGGNGK